MTRKDYRLLADHMIATRDLYINDASYGKAVIMLGQRLAHDNPNFNFGLFNAACYNGEM